MSLLTDCLAAGGTLGVAIGSGLQAAGELRRYGAVASGLGLTRAAAAARGLWRAYWPFYGAFFGLPWSLWPGFRWSVWRLPRNARSFYKAAIEYYRALRAVGSAELTDKFTQEDKTDARELAWKSGYWFLIMIGTLVVFAGSLIGIISDLS